MNRTIRHITVCTLLSTSIISGCSADAWDWVKMILCFQSIEEQIANLKTAGNDCTLAQHLDTSLRESQVTRHDLSQKDLTLHDLSDAHMERSDMRLCKFILSDCSRANLQHAHATGANFLHAKLTGSDAAHADLQKASLQMADGRGMNLRYADARGTNFSGGDFRGARIYGMQVDAQTTIKGARFGWRRPIVMGKIAVALAQPYVAAAASKFTMQRLLANTKTLASGIQKMGTKTVDWLTENLKKAPQHLQTPSSLDIPTWAAYSS